MSYDSRPETYEHIGRVAHFMHVVIVRLIGRIEKHDQTKLSGMEKEAFDIVTPRLAEIEYGSEEYKASLREIRPAIDEHYRHNSHHPEHYENGIAGMNLLDLIEMLCDWRAASERGKPRAEAKDGERAGESSSLLESLDHNVERFDIEPQLASVLRNTIMKMEWS